jgi:hypothetical protein
VAERAQYKYERDQAIAQLIELQNAARQGGKPKRNCGRSTASAIWSVPCGWSAIPASRCSSQALRARTHKLRLFGNRWLPQTTCADCAGISGDLLPPSQPTERATTSKSKSFSQTAPPPVSPPSAFPGRPWGGKPRRLHRTPPAPPPASSAHPTNGAPCPRQTPQKAPRLRNRYPRPPAAIVTPAGESPPGVEAD